MLTVKDLLAALNDQQREAVTYSGGPLLVTAGPGSGKTRIITYRAAWFVRARGVEPEHILAVTFTNRAAEEMRGRLYHLLGDRGGAMWVYTFHATALRLLRRHGDRINLSPGFAVADEQVQRALLTRVMRQLGLSLEQHPLHAVADFISRRKARLLDPTRPLEEEPVHSRWLDVAAAYQDALRAERLLDFDDLLITAVHLLRACPQVRQHLQGVLTHILVDEYQDINLAQFVLLTLLAPPGAEVTAVADTDQSIYGWRGADPHLVDRFRRYYRPHEVVLTLSYRSTAHILYAAQRFVARRRLREQQSFLHTVHEQGEPIYHYIFQTLSQEQRWLARVIQGLVKERDRRYRDIAILYRTHALADPLEQYLLQQRIPLQRVRPRDYFDADPLREVVRYLALLHTPTDQDYIQALNFPAALVDEPTQAQIQHLARGAGVTFGEVARHPENFPRLSPLTRWHLTRFREAVSSLARTAATLPLPTLIDRLFTLLDARRSPFTPDEHRVLRRFQRNVRFDAMVAVLKSAVQQGRPIALVLTAPPSDVPPSGSGFQPTPSSLDLWAAAHILYHTLAEVLGAHVILVTAETTVPEGSLHVFLTREGSRTPSPSPSPAPSSTPQSVTIAPLNTDIRTHPLTVVAWRVATDLLVAFEPVWEETYVVYDLETTGTDVRRDDVVEIAAQRYRGTVPVGAPFHALVRPTRRHFIPTGATRVHGITWDAVADAPPLEEVLPAFLDYIGDSTLVGHNVRQFDNRFLDRALGEHLGRGLTNPTVDTLVMARQLFPAARHHTLEHLLRVLGLEDAQEHRAARDVAQTAALYHALVGENLAWRAREALPEVLPLIALGLLDASARLEGEHRALLNGALRVLARSKQHPQVDALVAHLDEHLQWRVLDLLARLRDTPVPEDSGDTEWERLREQFAREVDRYLQSGGEPTLAAFLDYQALRTALDEADPEADAVTLMTLHNAKGTEFPVVIIVGLEDGNLPLWTIQEDEAARSEERRVFYVGMTRAQERLYLSTVLDRGEGIVRQPSPFVFEVDGESVRRFQVDRRGRVRPLTLNRRR